MSGETTKLTVTVELEPMHACTTCGVWYAMPKDLLAQRIKDGATFYCPNGHQQAYTVKKEPDRIAELEKSLATMRKRDDQLTAWVKRAPHLDICDVRVGRDCDCGRKALVGDVEAPVTTARN